MSNSPDDIISAKVVPWEIAADTWGVSLTFRNGMQRAFQVGSKAAAEAAARQKAPRAAVITAGV